MKKFILLTVIFAVMCVTTSHAMTILIDGDYLWNDAGGTAIVTWFQQNFPGATVTRGSYSNTTDAGIKATIEAADLLVINRRTYSGGYDLADGVYYSGLTKPVIFLTSYVTRSSKIAFEGGLNAGGGVDGAETTVTAAGAALFGVAVGTYDFYTVGMDTLGTGSVGTGKILATIGGNNLAVLWGVGDTDGSARVQAGKRLLYNVNAITGGTVAVMPDTTAGLNAFSSVVKSFISRTDTAHDPVVTPVNTDGKCGDVEKVAGVWQVHNVVLGFKAGVDPNTTRAYPVNPNIVKHNIYLQTGAPTDPNLYLQGFVTQVYNANPYLTDSNNSYGPLPDALLKSGTVYQWKVEEALKDPNGNTYPAGNGNNIMGDVWSFTTASATPEITTNPAHTLTDTSGNATLTIVTTSTANNYRWFKEAGATDIQLSDGGIYSTTHTTTLTITGMASDGSQDAQYYAIAYNGDPEGAGIASAPSATVWVWYPRLVHHYAFETVTANVTPDAVTVGKLDATLTQESASAGMPVLNSTNKKVGSSCLELTNADTDPNGQYAQIGAGVVAYKDITVSAWIYPKTNAAWARVFDFGSTSTDYIFLAPSTGSVLRFAIKVANGTEQDLDGTAVLPVGQWSYVTVTLTGSTGRLYLNGTLISTSTTMTFNPVDMASSTPQNYIGKSQYTSDPEFDGMIDELKIYNYARTTVQVGQDYLADTQEAYVCNRETYDMGNYDTNNDCIIDLTDFLSFAARWLENDRIY